ncbi:MAG: RNA 2',3'-cyclic phosphodiesterase [Desulfuromonadales bacterium]
MNGRFVRELAMTPVRAFLAIPLSAELLRTTQQLCRELSNRLPRVRWVRPEAMHLTLRFFGDVPEEFLEKIGEVMLSVGRLHTPFQVAVAGIDAFPSITRPRVIWLGFPEGEILMHLYSTLAHDLEQAGIAGDARAFAPHLTLGRCREKIPGAGAVLEAYRKTACGVLDVDRIVLYESRLQPTGAMHLPRKTVLLGQPTGAP